MAAPAKPQYRPLQESAFVVSPTTRRARYWYSGSRRLDMGASPGVVGYVWTHWLLDRGLLVPGGPLDESYAEDLYAESQKVAEMDPGTAGSWIWAGEIALRSRGFVQESVACPDVESVVLALLERGPVIAGMEWHTTMDEPAWVGGRAVCRPAEGQVRGGSAVLLNAVDLDLELEGVTGFVRLKNSWGDWWGDHGQALLSLEDLGKLLFDDGALLPIPAPSALGPDAHQDMAEPETPPGGYGPQSIGSDLWTTHDTVGYGAYAEAIARGIQHAETAPPLTIGIKAPWGAGKTSLMRMIRDRLEWPSGKTDEELRPLQLVQQHEHKVTNAELLERAGSREPPPALDATPATPDPEHERWRPTVWFNPWMYQTGEQVWAGLAHEVITQVTGRMVRVDRERFWFELNRRRVDPQEVRRRLYALVLDRVLPAVIAGIVVVLVGLGLLLADVIEGVAALIAGPAGVAAVAIVQRAKVLRAPPTGAFASVVSPVTEQLIRMPDYASQTGFFYLLQADLQRVLDLVATPKQPLVVFVDDLDRCAPGTVVQVIEAINLFLAGQYPNCIFVVAMEPDMVAAHVEAAYGSLAQRLGADFDLGWRFLEKIVQLPLTLPAIEPDRAMAFAESLLGEEERPSAPAEPDASEPGDEPAETPEADPTGKVGLAGGVAIKTSDAERMRAIARRLSINDSEVKAAIAYAAGHLDVNPREIKRFVNIFRFLVMIHTERTIEGLATTATLEQLAKLALISTRWPRLMSTLAKPNGDATTFEFVESTDGQDPKGLPQALIDVLRAKPTVGDAARHYL